MFDFWYELPRVLRIVVALIPLAISLGLFFFANTVWPWGFVVGLVLLLFSGAGNDKSGYNF